ncbi:MAG: amidohydrolase family protein [Lentisphaerae bacterium]|nr:amidohydrolase family protein [Lentisphaerota bacterium]
MKTLLIKNAAVYDGSGAPPVQTDVLIESGRIAGIDDRPAKANTEIDASGLALMPGFIDVHGHSDVSIIAAPEAVGKISQGVTAEITGNCGLSPFPISTLNREHLEHLYRQYNCRIEWDDFTGYRQAVESRNPAINLLPLCGHNTLRAAVNGYREGRLNLQQLNMAAQLLNTQLEQGAGGFSSGLLYTPGCFSDEQEITALLTALAPFSRPYTTHLRSEGNQLLEAIKEAITSCVSAGQKHLHLSHFKTAGKANWHKLDDALELLAQAPLRITADRYPYIESMTNLSVILPDHLSDMTNEKLSEYLAEPDHAAEAIADLRRYPAERWRTCRLVSTSAQRFKKMHGKLLAEFSDPAMACVEIWRDDPAGAMAAFSGMSPDNLKRILALDFVACGSDESARPQDYRFGVSHPRGFGSFPEFFRQQKDVVSTAEIIRRVTAFPAAIFNLSGRGMIRPGYAADLALLDLDEYRAQADFAAPHRLASGVKLVLVNGCPAYGEMLNEKPVRAGKILQPN